MAKLQAIEGKTTNWMGLWWHPETNSFSSGAISLSELRKFKGQVRLYMRKNKYYNKGENGRPNYNFCLKDANAEVFHSFEVEDDVTRENTATYDEATGEWQTEQGNRLYTEDEVQNIINRCACYIGGDGEYGNHLVGDYI